MARLHAYEGRGVRGSSGLKLIGEPLQLHNLVVRHEKPGFTMIAGQPDCYALEELLLRDPRGKADRLYLTPDSFSTILILAGQVRGIELAMELYLQRPILVSLLTLPIESYRKTDK